MNDFNYLPVNVGWFVHLIAMHSMAAEEKKPSTAYLT